MLDLLTGFVQELRRAGLPVSLTENLDAVQALLHVPLDDREAFKFALGATLVKNAAHWATFETVFEVYFSLRGSDWELGAGGPAVIAADAVAADRPGAGDPDGSTDALDEASLAALLDRVLAEGDLALARALARQAVLRFAGMEAGRPVGGSFYLYRTLRHLDLDGALVRLLARAAEEAGGSLTPLEARLERDEILARIDRLRAEVEAEIRRRLVADRGAEAVARTVRRPLPEDVDFMHAGRDDAVRLRQALHPLTRKLAVRLARKRRHGRRGALDFRSTVRHSLSYGGVPADPRFRYPRPAKPEIVVLADISGSVAAFARFTLQLVHAMGEQFSRVRSFVFIDGIDEVTRLFEGADDLAEAVHRVNTEADVVWLDGHSDYGHALEVFWQRHGHEVGPRTTVLVLGDARNNYHASQAWVLKELRHRARHVLWLNPEPRSYWDTGDSVIGEYAAHCDGVYECRNLRQLERFVDNLA